MVLWTGRIFVQQTVRLPDGTIDGIDEGMEVGDADGSADGFELGSDDGPGDTVGASQSATEVSAVDGCLDQTTTSSCQWHTLRIRTWL